jgi:peroxiredoxin
MSATIRPSVQPGELVPGLALPTLDGERVRLRGFRQRRPIILAALHGAECAHCQAWLATTIERRREVGETGAELLIALIGTVEALQAVLPDGIPGATALADPEATLASACGAPPGGVALLAVDRYARLINGWVAPDADGLPGVSEPADWVQTAEHGDGCACALPAWDHA